MFVPQDIGANGVCQPSLETFLFYLKWVFLKGLDYLPTLTLWEKSMPVVKRNPSIEQICGNQTQPLTDTASQRNQTQPLSLLWRRWGHDDIITWSEHPLVICLSYDHKYLKAEMPLQCLLGYNGKSTMLHFHHNGQSKGKNNTAILHLFAFSLF